MDHDPEALEDTVLQLQSSGIQFSVEFIGSVAFETSMNIIPAKYQSDVAQACIILVAKEAKIIMADNLDQFSKYIDNAKCDLFNRRIDMNISSSAIVLIEEDGFSMRVLYRFNIRDISVVSPGKDELASFFCFFAKVPENGNISRRCFVFDAKKEVDEVREIICFAFRISEMESESKVDGNENGNRGPQEGRKSSKSFFIGSDQLRNSTDMEILKLEREFNPDRPPPLPLVDPPELPPRPRRSFVQSARAAANESESSTRFLNPGCAERPGCSHHADCDCQWSLPARVDGRQLRSSSSSRGDMSVEVSEARLQQITRDLRRQSWFHGELERTAAESLLSYDDQFLVRQSPNMLNQFVLSGIHNNAIKHICLVGQDGKISSASGEFDSIVDLIQYYQSSQQPLTSRGVVLNLRHPVSK